MVCVCKVTLIYNTVTNTRNRQGESFWLSRENMEFEKTKLSGNPVGRFLDSFTVVVVTSVVSDVFHIGN